MVSPANGPEPDPRRSAPPFPQVEATNSVESSLSPIPLPQAKEPPKEESASIGLLNANGEDESDVEFVDPPPESRPPDAPAPKVEYNISYPAPNVYPPKEQYPSGQPQAGPSTASALKLLYILVLFTYYVFLVGR